MFHGVGHARHVIGIAKAADVHVDGGAGFVGVGVVDQQGFELVGESDHSIRPVVERRRLELVRNPLHRRHDGEKT